MVFVESRHPLVAPGAKRILAKTAFSERGKSPREGKVQERP
jgi:hypothetical protein